MCDNHLLAEIESTLFRFDTDILPDFMAIRDERALRYELIEALIRYHREAFTHRTLAAGTEQNVTIAYTLTHYGKPAYQGPAQAS